MSTVDNLRRLRQHFTQEQAEDILAVIETQAVTRDYLDARLEAMEKRLILWGIGLTGVIVTLVTTLDRAIPR